MSVVLQHIASAVSLASLIFILKYHNFYSIYGKLVILYTVLLQSIYWFLGGGTQCIGHSSIIIVINIYIISRAFSKTTCYSANCRTRILSKLEEKNDSSRDSS